MPKFRPAGGRRQPTFATPEAAMAAAEIQRRCREQVGYWVEIIDQLDRLGLKLANMGYGRASIQLEAARRILLDSPPEEDLKALLGHQ